jgi:hypothetical protein
MKELGIVNVGFDVTDEVLNRVFPFLGYWKTNGNTVITYS